MKLRVAEVRFELGQDDMENLRGEVTRRLNLTPKQVLNMWVVRQAVDARRKGQIAFVYTVEVLVDDSAGYRVLRSNPAGVTRVEERAFRQIARGTGKLGCPPVIIGAGPAGLFAALTMARWGYRPLLLERGREILRRTRDVEVFWQTGELDPASNVQFGEGGAGTFSDGKLTTRIKDGRVRELLNLLVGAGAPEEVAWLHKPHIGTDLLRDVVVNLRKQLISMGGRVRFEAQATGLCMEQGRVAGVEVNQKVEVPAGVVVLAIGHSARDTYEALYAKGVSMEPKPFAIGLRVEHPQLSIDEAQYGPLAGHPRLGSADYHLTYHSEKFDRNAYTFCMCPGGYVVAAASEPGGVVTNGMSRNARDSGTANSAVVVSVGPEDFGGDGTLAGIGFQRKWEQAAFRLGGGSYRAPVQRVMDYVAGRPSAAGELPETTYRPGTTAADLRGCLPGEVSEVLAEALQVFDRKLAGFAGPEAVLTGVETRTSAPVRLLRDHEGCSLNCPGLYPAGEGAGYAGGIISAAVDGMRVAESIIGQYGLPLQDFPETVLQYIADGGIG